MEESDKPKNLEEELLPCPFCGSKALGVHYGEDRSYGTNFWEVKCTNWRCSTNQFTGYDKEEAIAKWNRREKNSLAIL
jgi:Lar family restriction alleviation protein